MQLIMKEAALQALKEKAEKQNQAVRLTAEFTHG